MVDKYNVMHVCINGHILSVYRKTIELTEKYCTLCGLDIISQCQSCKTQINGSLVDWPTSPDIPYYCKDCSHPFPWTLNIIENSIELAEMDENLDSKTREIIKNAIPHLITDSPTSAVNIGKFNKVLEKTTPQTKALFKELLNNAITQRYLDLLNF